MSEVQAMISNNKMVICDDRLNIDNHGSIIQNKTKTKQNLLTKQERYRLLEETEILSKMWFISV